MPQDTPNLALTTPLGSEVPNVPADMRRLAMQLDGLLKTAEVAQPIIMIDPNESDFGWNDFPLGSSSGDVGYSGVGNSTSWDTSRVLNPEARWKFTAPTDGLLHVSCYILLGYNNSSDTGDRWQDFFLDIEVLSGSANTAHPDYARNRIEAEGGRPVGIVDWTAKLVTNFIITKGSEVSPFISWRGVTHRESGSWRPKWSGGRMQAFFIPGRTIEVNPPSHNVGGQNPNRSANLGTTTPDPDDTATFAEVNDET